MDGVMKQLDDYLKALSKGGKIDVGETALQALRDTIDDEIEKYQHTLLENMPTDTGALKKSLKVENVSTRSYYGYSAYFEGEDKHGEPYEKIANVLNYGTDRAGKKNNVRIYPAMFITIAIHRLKGMDDRAAELAEQRIIDRMK